MNKHRFNPSKQMWGIHATLKISTWMLKKWLFGSGISLPIWANLGIHVKGKLSTSLKGPKIENTPPKTNMEHNHGGLEDNVSFNMGDFQSSVLVFGEYICLYKKPSILSRFALEIHVKYPNKFMSICGSLFSLSKFAPGKQTCNLKKAPWKRENHYHNHQFLGDSRHSFFLGGKNLNHQKLTQKKKNVKPSNFQRIPTCPKWLHILWHAFRLLVDAKVAGYKMGPDKPGRRRVIPFKAIYRGYNKSI